ncbi:Hypothetical predicted protein [Olea europaea subsp. europaea]|uniref:FAF domain-containing protein n=1 Tax=Olea europaea subsp. europaea TaxID=158383 RepID=A0A8S0PBT5_OLEEU|nr:Hypothetical predicted protein [Olea europaea subsp. europaea]
MSSTANVCQVLPSCLEPSLVELMFQLAPSKPDISIPWTQMPSLCSEENSHVCLNNYPTEKSQKKGELGGWNSIQSLSKSSDTSENVYVHPLDKRASCAMSTKSLELCTESLGCETGSKINGGMDEFNSLLSMERKKPSGIRHREISKKKSKTNNFPPPLTSITGSNGVQVSIHREGGRLVIKAVNSSSCNVHFQTERENGRLRLSLPKQDYWHFSKHMEDENEEETALDEKDEEEEEEEEEANAYETENESYDRNNGEGEDESDLNGGFWGENGETIGCNIGSSECRSSSRCKEDSKRLPSLHICVAIS